MPRWHRGWGSPISLSLLASFPPGAGLLPWIAGPVLYLILPGLRLGRGGPVLHVRGLYLILQCLCFGLAGACGRLLLCTIHE